MKHHSYSTIILSSLLLSNEVNDEIFFLSLFTHQKINWNQKVLKDDLASNRPYIYESTDNKNIRKSPAF